MDYSGYLHSANKSTTSRDASLPKFGGKLFTFVVPIIIELFGVSSRQFWSWMAFLIVKHHWTSLSSHVIFPVHLLVIKSSLKSISLKLKTNYAEILPYPKYQFWKMSRHWMTQIIRPPVAGTKPCHYPRNFSIFSCLLIRTSASAGLWWPANRSGSICRQPFSARRY